MTVSTGAIATLDQAAAAADLEATFEMYFARLARVIARVINDPGRAEELAVDVLMRWSKHPSAHGEQAGGWLYRTAVRMALDEYRRQARRARFERLRHIFAPVPTPEDLRTAKEEQLRVRSVLATLRRVQASLLLLRSDGLSYADLAAALQLNPASIGTFLARAERAFRKEYTKRYGHQQ